MNQVIVRLQMPEAQMLLRSLRANGKCQRLADKFAKAIDKATTKDNEEDITEAMYEGREKEIGNASGNEFILADRQYNGKMDWERR